MLTQEKTIIKVENTVEAPIEWVWECWTKPEHITKWNYASEDWHAPSAQNDLREGGSFLSRMEAKDGSMGFDFAGVYDVVKKPEYIEYTLGDGRKVDITFSGNGKSTTIVENFEAENTNSLELQKGGWQAILDNFKKHAETTVRS